VDHLREHQTEIAIASVVWHELWYGCYRLPASNKRSVIEAYLNNVVARAVPMLPYDQQAARWHAKERARLAQIGGRGWAVVGSLNGGEVSAKLNREMALLVGSDEAYAYLADVFWYDWGVTP